MKEIMLTLLKKMKIKITRLRIFEVFRGSHGSLALPVTGRVLLP